MRFSIYSELQSWPGKSYDRLYGEVLEQIENADRLGYEAYAAVEHLFFPKFSASANVFGLFGMAAARTRRINFRTMLHILPYHNPLVLAAMIHEFSLLSGGRYEFGVGRGHGWIPLPAGMPLDETSRPRYEEALDLFVEALHSDVVSFEGDYWNVKESQVIPFSGHKFRVVLGGTSDRTYDLAAKHGWSVAVPPLLPYAALKEQLDLYRAKCAEYGTTPDIIWIHACYIDDDADLARREAEQHMRGFLAGNASPLTEHPVPPVDALNAAGYGFYAVGDHGEARRDAVRRDDRGRHRLGRHARRRDPADPRDDRGLRGADRDRDHDEPRRRRALEGDQGAGALRRARHPGHPAGDRGGRGRGVTSVVVAGAGSIGSLLAAHLAQVANVTVLTRREEHAAALREQGLRVSGRSDFTARLDATADPAALPADAGLAILTCKSTDLDPLAARLEGVLPGATVMTIQNGLGAEEIVAAHGEWPLLSAVTFMSGTRHGDAHVEYVLDTATWIGPYRGTTEADARRVAELIEASGLKAEAFPDLRPAQWSKLIFNATVNGVAALTGLPHDFHFAQTEQLSDLGQPRPRSRRRGKARRRRGRRRAPRRPVGDERPRDPTRPPALPLDARGRGGEAADRGRAHQRSARARGGTQRCAGSPADRRL